jgi:hypothetical protein
MRISEVDKAMGAYYRAFKQANGGKKTSPKGKYGFKTIQFLVQEVDGTIHGPFFGRGSALTTYQEKIKKVGKPIDGVKFIVQQVYKSKDKKRAPVVDAAQEFPITVMKVKA